MFMFRLCFNLRTDTVRRKILPSLSEHGRGPLYLTLNRNSHLLNNRVTWDNGEIVLKEHEVLFFSDVFMDVAVAGS